MRPLFPFEFHVSRIARDRYRFDRELFGFDGKAIFADFRAARLFAQRMNEQRDLARYPERAVAAGQIHAMGLLDELLHLLAARYRERHSPDADRRALAAVTERLGDAAVDAALLRFAEEFPTVAVYRGEAGAEEQLADGREVLLEEMLFLWLANANPALARYRELFDDASLAGKTAYRRLIGELEELFAREPAFGAEGKSLFELLRAPALACPHSLREQLEFLREHFAEWLGDDLQRLLGSLDLIAEEERVRIGVGGPGPAQVPDFGAQFAAFAAEGDVEYERFSPDRDWMPRLVLMAKNVYVWMDQLSKQYGRAVCRLDEIPDEELDRLAGDGFTGLWLIGLWERSRASRRIKHLCGNPDAAASAYSLDDYVVAERLGGDGAFEHLEQRAWQRGIRMSTDMVPNHMGVDSRWLVERPDFFLSLDHCPYPQYSFQGENLSHDDRMEIRIEDRYYDRTDAAVVFQTVDRRDGRVRYVYHGNDGTSMPWNDTAQLDFLHPEAREAVIETILAVARRSPVIRFDAAMVLARKSIHRLWYPEPGSGDGIPSRAEHGLTRADFEQKMPAEFWREVVDRVAAEVPDTLLLAEAFWLMEGYFVRTLGMHRVYNSAFMHMLRDENNVEYRQVMKNTLEFDPQVLGRYVNFVSNPDEDTAVGQFGDGDKYFGCCTLLATLPGLPMFGHGQLEGFTEKYGMEYQRAYYEELPDEQLLDRHRREIFPLLHRRALFAGVADFLLYDLVGEGGQVHEDVFVYSNRLGGERALVVYHNRFGDAAGWIRDSAAYSVPAESGRELVRKGLAEGLGLAGGDRAYVAFRDQKSGLQYLRRQSELFERGLYLELRAYYCHVFLEFQEIHDGEDGRWRSLHDSLAGRGVPSLEQSERERHADAVLALATEEETAATAEISSRPISRARRRRKSDVILAGDIGGTKTLLALFRDQDPEPLASESFASQGRPSFEPLLAEFLERHPPGEPIRAACLGVAGPVIDNRCRTTNLPFYLDGDAIAQRFSIERVELVNDLTATAEGIPVLGEEDQVELLAGESTPNFRQPAGLLAAGTGLGMAVLAPRAQGHWRPLPSEGSHVELAPRNEEEDALLAYLRRLYPEHVSVERAVSGPGLLTLYEFFASRGVSSPPEIEATIRSDELRAPALVSGHGLTGECPRCRSALELFVSLLGSAAGNLALTLLATGGIFLGGGIPPRILPALHWPVFRSSFVGKGRYRYILETIPVIVLTEPRTALLGAARRAREARDAAAT